MEWSDEADGPVRARLVSALAAYAAARSELGRHFARQMDMHTTDAAAMVEITAAQGSDRPLTPARLAERIGLTRGATSILLGRLEVAGHVERRRDHPDRRVVTLHAGAGVQESAARYFAPLAERVEAVLATYTAEDLIRTERVVTELLGVHRDHLGQVER